MNQNNSSKVLGIVVALLVIAAIVIAVNYQAKDEVVNENESAATEGVETPLGKVAAANVEDGEYYTYIETINQNPEDTTVTFKHVMYFEGEEASSTAATEGKSGEVRADGSYVRESGAPNFTAPLSASASMNAEQLRSAITEVDPRPVFLVVIEEGAVAGISVVGKK